MSNNEVLNLERATTKAQFLDLAENFMVGIRAERGRLGALKSFLHNFNNGYIGEEIRAKLRKGQVQLRVYYKWQRAFREQGISGLLEKYHGSGPRVRQEIRVAIEHSIRKNHLCRYRDIYNDLCLQFSKKTLPSYWAVRMYAIKFQDENRAELVLLHEGARGLRDRNMKARFGKADADLTEPNERWEIDTTLADVFTITTGDGKRVKVIGIIDVYSRMMKFYLVEKETSFTVGLALKDRFLTWGKPQEVVYDNGKSFKNRRIRNFLKRCGTVGVACHPGTPEEKPHVERGFRTVTEGLFRLLPGYSGNSVANRPTEIRTTYTTRELQEIIDRWVDNVYAETVHGSTDQRPRERMAKPGFVPQTFHEKDLEILLMMEEERRVTQGHIKYSGGKYFHPLLPEGRKVKIRVNDLEASELLVYVDGEFLCVAEDYVRKGKTPEQIREGKKERSRELRTRVKAHKALLAKYADKPTGVIAQIAQAESKRPRQLPRRVNVVDLGISRGVQFTREHDQSDAQEDEQPSSGIIRNQKEMYFSIKRKMRAGKALDDNDRQFMEEFEDSPLRFCKARLDRDFEREVGNA